MAAWLLVVSANEVRKIERSVAMHPKFQVLLYTGTTGHVAVQQKGPNNQARPKNQWCEVSVGDCVGVRKISRLLYVCEYTIDASFNPGER